MRFKTLNSTSRSTSEMQPTSGWQFFSVFGQGKLLLFIRLHHVAMKHQITTQPGPARSCPGLAWDEVSQGSRVHSCQECLSPFISSEFTTKWERVSDPNAAEARTQPWTDCQTAAGGLSMDAFQSLDLLLNPYLHPRDKH